MKFQFSTSTLVLLVTFIAISLGGAMPLVQAMTPIDWNFAVRFVPVLSQLWVPPIFVAYAIGRRAITPKLVALFAAMEGANAAAFYVWRS